MKRILFILFVFLASAVGVKAQEAYAVLSEDEKTLTFYCDDNKNSREGTLYELNEGKNDPDWLKKPIKLIEFDISFADARPTTTYKWFKLGVRLREIRGIQYLNTQDVTNMSYMFSSCFFPIDLSHLDTHNVTDMSSMFRDSKFPLNLSHFDTRNVTNMSHMFDDYSGSSLDLSTLNTCNVTDMSYMFASTIYSSHLDSLKVLDLHHFDTHNVTDMKHMFFGRSHFKSLNLSSFDTHNVTDMTEMFGWCRSLNYLDLSSFDTRNVLEMSGMFSFCYSLISLDLSNFNTENVLNMSTMFMGCSSLTSLDLSHFDTGNVIAMRNMFNGCSSLTSLDLSNFDTQNVTDMSGMFSYCYSLSSLIISASLGNSLNDLSSSACEGDGTEEKPCLINQPEGFEFGVDTSGDYFRWQQGYFKLMENQMEQINVTTDLGFITHCSDKALDFTNVEGMKAYIVVGYDGKVAKLSRIGIVPPETGLLLKADAGEYEVPYTEEDNYVMNMLIGVLEETTLSPTEGNMTNLILANGKNGLGFYCLKGSGTIAAHRAYLQVPTRLIENGAKFISMEFDDDVTAINGIKTEEEATPYYDLQGVRHEGKPSKQGIYIMNGKKVVVKD